MASSTDSPTEVALAIAVSNLREPTHAGVTPDDLVVTGTVDLPEPPDADLRRAVRARPDLAVRRAAEAVADGRCQALVADSNSALTAAAATFVSGTQRGASQPVLAALLPRPGLDPLVLADLAAGSDSATATALTGALAQSLDAIGSVVSASEHCVGHVLTDAMSDPSVTALVVPPGVAAGIMAGRASAGEPAPIVVVLGLPIVAVVGHVADAAPLARALHLGNLVGYTEKALADLVSTRRAAAGLT